MSGHSQNEYYLPTPSSWPIKGCVALSLLVIGAANWLHQKSYGPFLFIAGVILLVYMMYGWFGKVIQENRQGVSLAPQVARSFKWGMVWFIFSEVCFFGAFFGALFYARIISVPTLAGANAHGMMTHYLLWPNFHATWPLLKNPALNSVPGPKSVMDTWGIPAINTAILLTSGFTITIAHWALVKENFKAMIAGQVATILLGMAFLTMQVFEYTEAYMDKGLTLASGIYGSTFFMLTGFHAAHVTIGTISLMVILHRMLKRDFSHQNHFGFAAVSWYWHFVDVVWLLLFVLVYWI